MSDLISRKSVLKSIATAREEIYQMYLDGSEMDTMEVLNKVIDTVVDEPTAYDVDKVVEQLKECERYVYDAVSDEDNYVINTEKAIEIVKGAVKDE